MRPFPVLATLFLVLVALVVASALLLWSVLGTAPWEKSGPNASVQTNSTSVNVQRRGDCGSGNLALSSLRAVMPTASDLGGEYGPETVVPAAFKDLGDEVFKSTVDSSSFLGGYSDLVYTGAFLSGGKGKALFAHVVAFQDSMSARALVAHPFVGKATTASVPGVRFGDETAAIHYVVAGSPALEGYVIEYRVGALVVDAASVGNGVKPELAQTEQLARLVCGRLRTVAP